MFSVLEALLYISAFSLGFPKMSLSLLYNACLRLVLTYASFGWCFTLRVKKLERFHRVASRAIIGCPCPSLFVFSLRFPLPSGFPVFPFTLSPRRSETNTLQSCTHRLCSLLYKSSFFSLSLSLNPAFFQCGAYSSYSKLLL